METKAIVILYDGTTPNRKQLKAMLEQASFIEDQSTVKVETIGFSKLCKILAESVTSPATVSKNTHTENGDSSVIYLAEYCRDISSIDKLAVDIIKGLTDHGADPAFMASCSFIAQGSPVSAKIAKKYGFTETTRSIITQLYNSWLNND